MLTNKYTWCAGCACLLALVTVAFASTNPTPGTTTYQADSNVSGTNTTYTVTTTVASSASTQAGYAYNRLGSNGVTGQGKGDRAIDDCIVIIVVNGTLKVKVKINVCDQTATVWRDTDDDGTIDEGEPTANVPMTNHVDPPT